ncbi:hypothetical protein [Campylobacter concisus]|uniref:hypothetical protein n=1 Tax=Campylobacter concisus TaxID=199 RepID=UPI0015E1AF83|nr:hypothetical protein [Campylobacter concisus]QPH88616.1 hypothetical protein CVT15_07875 [Campylobacter concisus]QPI03565.1 hypothetical protein G5B95_07830 [Campylobacter concisus]
MSEHITALNLVLNVVQPKFSSLLRRVNKILKFVRVFYQIYKNEFKEYLFIYVNLPERI